MSEPSNFFENTQPAKTVLPNKKNLSLSGQIIDKLTKWNSLMLKITTVSLVLGLISLAALNNFTSDPKKLAQAASSPQGVLEKLNCAFGSGFAWDPDDGSKDVGIQVYAGGPFGIGTLVQSTSANQNPQQLGLTSNVQSITGDGNRHGFFFYIPGNLRNNQQFSLYIYALDATGDNGTLLSNQTLTCPNGDASITADLEGSPVKITVTDRLAGAIDSLTWRGKEFVNSWDHGRQIQYMWQANGLGECYNPTEAGTYEDDKGPNSTSILEYIQASGNTLVTANYPGYWARPATPAFFCTGATTSVNENLATNDKLVKQVQIGHQGMAGVIKMNASVSVTKPFNRLFMETPAAILDSSFSKVWRYNPKTQSLQAAVEDPKYQSAIFSYRRLETTPPILSTPDGQFAMGAYATSASTGRHITYSVVKYPNSDPNAATNVLSISTNEDAVPVGDINHESFLIVGTLASVQATMNQLYQTQPVDTQLPDGSFDGATCEQAFGWAWDPKAPDTSIQVEVYTIDSSNNETILGRTTANLYNQGVQNLVTQDNGLHTFVFPIPANLKNGQDHRLYARAINTDANLVNPHIQGMSIINCPPPSSSSSSSSSVSSINSSVVSSSSLSSSNVSSSIISSSVSSSSLSSSTITSSASSSSNSSNLSSSISSSANSSVTSSSTPVSSLSSSLSSSSSLIFSSSSSFAFSFPNFSLPSISSSSSTTSSSLMSSSLPSSLSSSSPFSLPGFSSQSLSSSSISSISSSSNFMSVPMNSSSSSSFSAISQPSLISSSSSSSSSTLSASQPLVSSNSALSSSPSFSANFSTFSSSNPSSSLNPSSVSSSSSFSSSSNTSLNQSSSSASGSVFFFEEKFIKFDPSKTDAPIFGAQDINITIENLPFSPATCSVSAKSPQTQWQNLPATLAGGVCRVTLTKEMQVKAKWSFQVRLTDQSGQRWGSNLDYTLRYGPVGNVVLSAKLL